MDLSRILRINIIPIKTMKPRIPYWLSGALAGVALLAMTVSAQEKQAQISVFKDKKLEAAVRRYVFEKRDTDKPITSEDVAKVSTIEAKGQGIIDLSGLEHCKALALLDLGDNQIKDLSPLRGMTMLQSLTLTQNQIEDLSPLANLYALQYLELSGNRVKSIAPLSSLTNMASLYLSTNQLTDLSPAFKLARLSSLYADHNQVAQIDGLNQLTRLGSLSLSGNRIQDISPLKGLKGLSHVFLNNNQIQSLAPLADMVEADAKGEQRFAPFINLYIAGNPLKNRRDLARLESAGARIQSK
jgi:internalin A